MLLGGSFNIKFQRDRWRLIDLIKRPELNGLIVGKLANPDCPPNSKGRFHVRLQSYPFSDINVKPENMRYIPIYQHTVDTFVEELIKQRVTALVKSGVKPLYTRLSDIPEHVKSEKQPCFRETLQKYENIAMYGVGRFIVGKTKKLGLFTSGLKTCLCIVIRGPNRFCLMHTPRIPDEAIWSETAWVIGKDNPAKCSLLVVKGVCMEPGVQGTLHPQIGVMPIENKSRKWAEHFYDIPMLLGHLRLSLDKKGLEKVDIQLLDRPVLSGCVLATPDSTTLYPGSFDTVWFPTLESRCDANMVSYWWGRAQTHLDVQFDGEQRTKFGDFISGKIPRH